jgi:hypothetical protein
MHDIGGDQYPGPPPTRRNCLIRTGRIAELDDDTREMVAALVTATGRPAPTRADIRRSPRWPAPAQAGAQAAGHPAPGRLDAEHRIRGSP